MGVVLIASSHGNSLPKSNKANPPHQLASIAFLVVVMLRKPTSPGHLQSHHHQLTRLQKSKPASDV